MMNYRLCTLRMIASSSLTPDAVVCARPTPTLSLFREHTLGSETGSFSVARPKVWNSLPAKTWHRICAVETTFKGISVWRDCGAPATFCLWTDLLTHILESHTVTILTALNVLPYTSFSLYVDLWRISLSNLFISVSLFILLVVHRFKNRSVNLKYFFLNCVVQTDVWSVLCSRYWIDLRRTRKCPPRRKLSLSMWVVLRCY